MALLGLTAGFFCSFFVKNQKEKRIEPHQNSCKIVVVLTFFQENLVSTKSKCEEQVKHWGEKIETRPSYFPTMREYWVSTCFLSPKHLRWLFSLPWKNLRKKKEEKEKRESKTRLPLPKSTHQRGPGEKVIQQN